MIDEHTLFILGAGASRCYGYPTGRELQKKVITDFHSLYQKFLLNNGGKIGTGRADDIIEFSKAFDSSRNEMIDYYLAKNNDPQIISLGKLAILFAILDAEISNAQVPHINFSKEDWFSLIFHQMTSTIRSELNFGEFLKNKVSFITFNYDRTLEHFFSEAIYYSYGTSLKKMQELLKSLQINHIFGRLPKTDFEKIDNSEIVTAYGSIPTPDLIYKMRNSILTIHERSAIDNSIIKAEIKKAKKIFFLGFGFAQENMELLDLSKNIESGTQIYASAYQLSGTKIQRIKSILKMIHQGNSLVQSWLPPPIVVNCNCRKLLEDYF